MECMNQLKDSIDKVDTINLNGIDYVAKSNVITFVEEAADAVDTVMKANTFTVTNSAISNTDDWKPSINCDEQEKFIRSHTKPINIVWACLAPFFAHLVLCVVTQLTKLNFEGVTGGVIRSATGTLAIMGIFALAFFILTKYVIRILYVRYTVSSCEQYPAFDGITDYKQLTSWQRLKFDLVIIFGLLLSFSILFIGQLLGFLQIPTTNLNP